MARHLRVEYPGSIYHVTCRRLGDLSRTVAHEPDRDLVHIVENRVGQTTVSKFEYANDALSRRTAREDTGSAFTLTQANAFIDF